MQLLRQTLDEILEKLSPVETDWLDAHGERVIALLESFPTKEHYTLADVGELLDGDFEAGSTALRLFLALSKDEFIVALRSVGATGWGVKRYRANRVRLLGHLDDLGILTAITGVVGRPTTWTDVLIERLRSGRGSAIKGQKRGRSLEDFTERIVMTVFGPPGNYDVRCRFVGETGESTEKCEFAIPTKEDPRILVEAKAYGATGSKQTDVIGDVVRIIDQKRHDTTFLLVTDGVTWVDRKNDLRKLLELQNRGRIARIYTIKMAKDLERDLRQLREENQLPLVAESEEEYQPKHRK